MSNTPSQIARSPFLPRPLALPLSLIPTSASSQVLVKALERIFEPELADGEVDFLEGRIMLINVVDARLSYRITLVDGKLKAADGDHHDLSIEGSIYDFLLLATRQEDADTLFFNRRLKLGGDTELGLFVKNFLDAVELDDRLGFLLKVLNNATFIIGRMPDLNAFKPGRLLG
ncbi:ubiquinone anaerobic biosynthesis accessory factor UbiT [Candidatus Vondammii sp. HM_W22]|uniref:ubiquinone anaerobic biosynthesis accessory factor UbiT n=1 Tax=Candidatus Vondammii sp. HM_W22 TaxID=2687299 RepID=UPI001F1340F4|nr:SCP2 sterol-binding domain-containing protein [Candidatus Vondammii sp. HM_W22]